MNQKEEIGKKINQARKLKKMTQQELAEKLHISDKAVSNWETGKNTPDIELLKKIEEILEIELIEKIINKEKQRKKIILITISILHLILTIFLLIYFINNYNKINIYKISLDNEKILINNSYITITNQDILINLNNIEHQKLAFQPDYNIILYYKENNKEIPIIQKSNYKSLNINLNKQDKNYKLIKANIDNLYLKINYKDYDNKTISKNIKLITKKEISNNKLFYTKENTSSPNINTINLLKNNGYKKIENNYYEKQIDNDYYLYNVEKNLLYYEGKYEDVMIYAKYNKSNINVSAIEKNNKIIAYSTSEKNYLSSYEDIVNDKINEIEKITYTN